MKVSGFGNMSDPVLMNKFGFKTFELNDLCWCRNSFVALVYWV